MKLIEVLNEIVKHEKKNIKEGNASDEVSAVFVAILTSEGYLKCIPWTEEDSIFDQINLLANGLLSDIELAELARDLVELKYHDETAFKEVYQTLKEESSFQQYALLEDTMNDIIDDLDLGTTNVNGDDHVC